MLNILYYTSGLTGAGRVVLGISIGNALRRNNVRCRYTILSSSRFGFLSGDFTHLDVPVEPAEKYSLNNYKHSELYKTIVEYKPDILVVDLLWFTLHNFIRGLDCKKIFLCRQVHDRFFTISSPDGALSFHPDAYDTCLAIEPFTPKIKMKQINPLIIRNHNEILSRTSALQELGLADSGDKKVCLFAFNGKPHEFAEIKKMYSYLEDEGYIMVYSTNYQGGLFPTVDYFNAFDLIICGGGYNSFWEAVYFNKDALFVPVKRRFEDQGWRISNCRDYSFTENGADQLVRIIMDG